ncbi:MAG TPA: NB-ARC domain-containing protein [Chloroflexia bacterium]|nr:NB-ARC domain-containing protein [Chloroflexia bacterium]
MQSKDSWPEFRQGDTPQDYAANLVSRVFRAQSKAAEYFGVHRSTISRYQRPDYGDVEGHGPPPLGYLARLVLLFVERNLGKAPRTEEIAEAQRFFLEQMNRLLTKYQASYNYHRSFRDWDELRAEADKYLPARTVIPHPHPQSPPLSAPSPYLVPSPPHQGVFGREETLVKIEEMLVARTSSEPDVSPIALRGFGGIGKTTLAISIGRGSNVAALYPDGVLWAELGPEPTIRQLLNIWGDALNLDLRTEPDEAACEAMLRSALSQRRALIIVDDVWNPNHARHFLLGGPNCRVLFTTRASEIAYTLTTPDRTLKVDLLSPAASLQMLQKLAPQAVALDQKAAERLCSKLDGLPLAIKLAGQLLAMEADVPPRMRKLVDELIERREARLGLLQSEPRQGLPDDEPPSLKAILGMSLDRLTQTDKERFAMLGVFGGEPLTWEIGATAAVWECDVDEAEATTSHLIQRGLVELRPDNRYWMHALLADYAISLMEEMTS